VAGTGLSTDPAEYRARLDEQTDEQIDTWAAELMRDVAKRRGVLRVIADLRREAGLSDAAFEQVFASGGGAPAVVGRDVAGNLMVPAITLHVVPAGLRARSKDGRADLIAYLVSNFDELVYV
jgi:hypothetical protein